ncbi:MAG: N-6 DNA methylase [Candidatus Riflebacteria bacterium]|nr:N-6 DNA methylase [Candidatus Riflebacteria bacterium]
MLNIQQTSEIIGVSVATIRNWVKSGVLLPIRPDTYIFNKKNIQDFVLQLSNGSKNKLTSRANKIALKGSFVPLEYFADKESQKAIKTIAGEFLKSSLAVETVMFVAALKTLVVYKEIKEFSLKDIKSDFKTLVWRRNAVKNLMTDWYNLLKRCPVKDAEPLIKKVFESFSPVLNEDCLGFLYQSLKCASDKHKKGSYYTPKNVSQNAVCAFEGQIRTILDPCCGTGNFLLSAAQYKSLSLKSLYGIDCDRVAVFVASLNLLLHFKQEDSAPNIICADALEFSDSVNFDLIATNPPWGARSIKSILKQTYKDSFSLFIEKSLRHINKNGFLSFVLPESFLNIAGHKHIRALILEKTKILRIVNLGKMFTGVFTSVIRLDLQEGVCDNAHKVAICNGTETFKVLQNRFLNNKNFVFDVNANETEQKLIEKIYAKNHLTLKNNAEWALGIVTGNNEIHLKTSQENGFEAVYKGVDIEPFRLKQNTSYIKFEPKKFQQCASEKYYRAKEKLIYKFISNKPVFAYDNTGAVTLNSANILIPKLPGYSVKTALGFLNSAVFRFLFVKKFMTHKVLKGDLQQLPFPILSKGDIRKIETETERLINGAKDQSKLDEIVFEVFEISEEEQKLIYFC